LLDEYPGLVRSVSIAAGSRVLVEFDTRGYDEGGLLVEFIYGSLSEAIYSIGLYLGVGIEHWENFNRSGNYPSPPGNVDFLSSVTLLERNLSMGVVEFPTGWLEKRIPSTYWREIAGEQK
jgi:hypothetical protein